ncbi:glycosyl transferase (plasmid) [Azospirillum sp. B510]|nr:glycosyl transferase [Azospirillum sp. B510]
MLVGATSPEGEILLKRYPVEPLERLGRQPWSEVKREVSRASVLMLPSLEDGFGYVMAQAMACGCPVIASEHIGARDLFTDEREGCIVTAHITGHGARVAYEHRAESHGNPSHPRQDSLSSQRAKNRTVRRCPALSHQMGRAGLRVIGKKLPIRDCP